MMGKVKTPFEMVLHYERMLDQKDKRITELEKSLGIANGYLRKGVEIDDQLIAEINRLRDALGKYGDCLPSCGIIGPEGRVYRVCTCGYNKALREVGDE